jgi:hypothetical protein
MSRAYRIRVRESLKRVLRAHDRVCDQLEILEILPRQQMGALLEQELLGRGFQRRGEVLVRQQNGVTVTVDPAAGTVTLEAEAARKIELEAEKEGRAFDDVGPTSREVRKSLREEARRSLAGQAEQQQTELETGVADELQDVLGAVRGELDQVVNRVTAQALKQKAAQLGEIKQITEDPETGSLTIVLEV